MTYRKGEKRQRQNVCCCYYSTRVTMYGTARKCHENETTDQGERLVCLMNSEVKQIVDEHRLMMRRMEIEWEVSGQLKIGAMEQCLPDIDGMNEE